MGASTASGAEPKSSLSKERLLSLAPVVLTVGYAAAVAIALLLALRFGDSWWPATLLIYGPRWPLLLPAALLLPWALWTAEWRVAITVVATALVVLGPYMGFRLSVAGNGPSKGESLRIATFNQGGAALESELSEFARVYTPDVLVVQECTLPVVRGTSFLPGYQERRSHSVCVLSRWGFRHFEVRDPKDLWKRGGSGEVSLATIESPHGTFNVLAVHLETVREGLEELIRFRSPRGLERVTELRRDESELARAYAGRAKLPLLVVGDLNMPVESRIYADYWSDFQNAFSECGLGYGATKRTRWFGIRIDHVLMDRRWSCTSATLGEDLGSDHRPLIVDVER